MLHAFFSCREQLQLSSPYRNFPSRSVCILPSTINLQLLKIVQAIIMLIHLVSLLFFLFALILAAPSSPDFYPPSKLLSKRYQIDCFLQTPQHPLCPAVPTDCMRALQLMRGGDKVDAPMEFSRATGFSLPYRWAHGTCQILIDIVAHGDPSEITTIYEISTRALQLIARCVIDQRLGRLGGRTTAGPNDMIMVGVMGVQTSDNRPPRLSPMAVVNQCLPP